MFQFRPAQKWYRCSPQRANWTKPRRSPVADSVSRLMVRGREHSTTGSGRTIVRSGRGPISYPTGQPSGSWKYVETGTSLYVQPRRLTKLICLLRVRLYVFRYWFPPIPTRKKSIFSLTWIFFKLEKTLAARGRRNLVWVSMIFAIIVSFMLFTVFPLVYVLYFKEFLTHDSRGFMILKNNWPNLLGLCHFLLNT